MSTKTGVTYTQLSFREWLEINYKECPFLNEHYVECNIIPDEIDCEGCNSIGRLYDEYNEIAMKEEEKLRRYLQDQQ